MSNIYVEADQQEISDQTIDNFLESLNKEEYQIIMKFIQKTSFLRPKDYIIFIGTSVKNNQIIGNSEKEIYEKFGYESQNDFINKEIKFFSFMANKQNKNYWEHLKNLKTNLGSLKYLYFLLSLIQDWKSQCVPESYKGDKK
jgi:hypothetical protein